MAKMRQFTLHYSEGLSINFQKVEASLSATYDLEEGEDVEAAMKEERRRIAAFVRFTAAKAIERFDTDGAWRARYAKPANSPEAAPVSDAGDGDAAASSP